MGRNMHFGRTTVPAVYRRPPRDISKYSASFKAAELKVGGVGSA